MANFELALKSRAFDIRGVRVNFDENRFGALLDSLVEIIPVDKKPVVEIKPAPIWGMSSRRRLFAELARDSDIYPTSYYSPGTTTIGLTVDNNPAVANQLLLRSSKEWSTDINGDLAEHQAILHDTRHARRGLVSVPAVAGAFAGFELGDGAGALVGGVVGLSIGLAADFRDTYASDYHTSLRDFVKDPQVLAEYSQIISYTAVA